MTGLHGPSHAVPRHLPPLVEQQQQLLVLMAAVLVRHLLGSVQALLGLGFDTVQ